MTIDELIIRINAYADPDPDSDWKYGKNYGIMMAISEIEKYREEKRSEVRISNWRQNSRS